MGSCAGLRGVWWDSWSVVVPLCSLGMKGMYCTCKMGEGEEAEGGDFELLWGRVGENIDFFLL